MTDVERLEKKIANQRNEINNLRKANERLLQQVPKSGYRTKEYDELYQKSKEQGKLIQDYEFEINRLSEKFDF